MTALETALKRWVKAEECLGKPMPKHVMCRADMRLHQAKRTAALDEATEQLLRVAEAHFQAKAGRRKGCWDDS